jgi:hypothetical protein
MLYPNLPSAVRPVAHNADIPVPSPPTTLEDIKFDSEEESAEVKQVDSDYSDYDTDTQPELFSQEELNDLVRDLGLPKDSAELLGSRLKSKKITFARYKFFLVQIS